MHENNGTAPAEAPAQTNSAATPEKPQGFGPVAGVSRDRDGKVFDAAKYLPKKDANGRWLRIGGPGKPGRPKGSKSATKPAESNQTAPEVPRADFSDVKALERHVDAECRGENTPAGQPSINDNSIAPEEIAERANSTPTAEAVLGILQMLLMIIGEEEGVLSPAEKMLLRPSLLRLLKKYEVGDDVIPAEAEFALAVAAVVIERIKKGGKTATTFAKAKAWALNMFFRGKGVMLGRDARREVPQNLVEQLNDRVASLQAELNAKNQPAAAVAA